MVNLHKFILCKLTTFFSLAKRSEFVKLQRVILEQLQTLSITYVLQVRFVYKRKHTNLLLVLEISLN